MSEVGSWFARVVGGASLSEVSKRSNIPLASLHRYVQKSTFSADAVVKIARAFDVSVPDALIAHGLVTADELSSVAISGTLADATDQQLLDEMTRRLARVPEGDSKVFDQPGPEKGGASIHYPEFGREPVPEEPGDDQQAVASPISDDDGFDTDYDG